MEWLLEKATDPTINSDNIDQALAFADFLKSRRSQFQTALKLIISKIRTWNISVAHQAITVLEICVEECGPLFINEIGRNIFLNELVKIVHPNYDGKICPNDIRIRILRMLHNWYIHYKSIHNIENLHALLLSNKILTEDIIKNVPLPLKRNESIGDEISNKKLAELLKTPKEENLRTARKIIKTIVEKEEEKIEERVKKINKYTEILEHCSVINDIIKNNPNPTDSIRDLLKELHDICENFLKQLQIDCDIAVSNNDPLLEEMLRVVDIISDTKEKYNYYHEQHSFDNVLLINFNDETNNEANDKTNDKTIPITTNQKLSSLDELNQIFSLSPSFMGSSSTSLDNQPQHQNTSSNPFTLDLLNKSVKEDNDPFKDLDTIFK